MSHASVNPAEPVAETGNDYVLPGGSHASLTEMTGVDEENIAKPSVAKNLSRVMTILLQNRVSSLDGKKPSEEAIRNLLTGDRDFLMLRLRQISLGNEYERDVTCGSCKKKFEVRVDLNKIEIKRMEKPQDKFTVNLPRGYKDVEGVLHKEVTLRLPTGVEQEYLSSDEAGDNRGSITTALLTRCCVQFGSLKSVSVNVIRNLTSADRKAMANVLVDNMPGPKLSLSLACSKCENEWEQPISVFDLFIGR